VLQSYALPSLRLLSAPRNRLRVLKANSFIHMQTLQVLNLAENYLKELPADVFLPLVQLEVLNLLLNPLMPSLIRASLPTGRTALKCSCAPGLSEGCWCAREAFYHETRDRLRDSGETADGPACHDAGGEGGHLFAPSPLDLFDCEARRRRKRAAQLLEMRGLGRWQRLRYAWGINRARGRSFGSTSLLLTKNAVATAGLWVLALPLRLILFPIFRLQARRERKRLEEKLKADAANAETGTRADAK
ncbi:unnamed protein product, partial [Cladocopium goreaui]